MFLSIKPGLFQKTTEKARVLSQEPECNSGLLRFKLQMKQETLWATYLTRALAALGHKIGNKYSCKVGTLLPQP